MKRKRWIAAGIISTCLFGVSGTYAYYQDTVSVRNHISTGDINIGIQEYEVKDGKESLYADPDGRLVLPSQKISKIPRITNYAQPCYVRVKIACTGEMLVLSEQDISGMPEEWIRAGEYYYLTDPLDTGESADVFQTVTIPEEWTEASSDQRLGITISAEAIQSDNFTPDFQSEQPWGDQETELCVHEQDGTVMEVQKSYQTMMVSYEGTARNLVAVPEDFFTNLGTAMPGDSLSDTAAIRNTTDTEAEFFFRTEIPGELTEEERELLEQFQLVIQKEGTMLYSGTLGAETLQHPVSLGRYQPGEEGSIHFTLTLPAKLDNAYARRETSVNWVFSVRGEEEEIQEPGPAIQQLTAPKTGLSDPFVAVPLLLAGLAAVSTWILERREEKFGSKLQIYLDDAASASGRRKT